MLTQPHGRIIICPYGDVLQELQAPDLSHVVSILGPSDELPWPDVGERQVCRLEFDDTQYSSGQLVAPSRQQIEKLIAFSKFWGGKQGFLVHCRAGTSRSPAAAMIALEAIGRADLIEAVITAKAYFRPHTGCLRLADAIMSPSPGLLAMALGKPGPVGEDEVGPVSISVGN
jgi:predicted protein tyrosine phosphatase